MDRYHIYLLHIWTEQAGEEEHGLLFRGALEEPHSGRRWAFTDIEGLAKCVEHILADMATEGPEGSTESTRR